MSDDPEKSETESEGPVGGERLRKARRANDISLRDIAKELHLDEQKVRALEKNEFDVLGAPVFAKGHLRKYAEIVGVDVDDIMTDYYQMNRSTGTPPVVGLKPTTMREINPMVWVGAAFVVLLIVGALSWWFATPAVEESAEPGAASVPAPVADEPVSASPAGGRPDAASATRVDSPTGEEAESTFEAGASPAEEVAPAVTEAMPAAGEDVPSAAADTAEPVAAPDPAPGNTAYTPTAGAPQVSVTLSFSADCWTEVTDSSGRRLFYDLGQAGRVVNLSGDAPLRLVLGDADSVSVSVEDRPWPIPASARRGRLARLTIPAQ
jgi:cytoskeleton protein RodZ